MDEQTPSGLPDSALQPDPVDLAGKILAELNNLHSLARQADMPEAGSLEMQRQIGQVALALQQLSVLIVKQLPEETATPAFQLLAEDLENLAGRGPIAPALPENVTLPPGVRPTLPSEDETRLKVPGYISALRSHSTEPLGKPRPKVLIGSLDRDEQALTLHRQALRSFDYEAWEVLDLGVNVPILVLAGAVVDRKPGVVVLAMSTAVLITEITWLIEHLRKKLHGVKIVIVGTPLGRIDNLGTRLAADLYSSDASVSAELATQALNPLNRMASPLDLDMSEMEQHLQNELPAEEPGEEEV